MKKLVYVFAILVTPLFFNACTEDVTDDITPQAADMAESELIEDEDVDDR